MAFRNSISAAQAASYEVQELIRTHTSSAIASIRTDLFFLLVAFHRLFSSLLIIPVRLVKLGSLYHPCATRPARSSPRFWPCDAWLDSLRFRLNGLVRLGKVRDLDDGRWLSSDPFYDRKTWLISAGTVMS
jgi:hypothetical protein